MGKKMDRAVLRAYAERGAAMQEIFAGERADLAEELRTLAGRTPATDKRAALVALALDLDALPILRATVQLFEATPRPA
jgi:hypothetical protein